MAIRNSAPATKQKPADEPADVLRQKRRDQFRPAGQSAQRLFQRARCAAGRQSAARAVAALRGRMRARERRTVSRRTAGTGGAGDGGRSGSGGAAGGRL
ncbi:MAG: hypothetical protein MZU84_05340 [Sphingobacterium sp.]|nr:hypothetical protein [Sphingobacterium sp.]